MVSVYILFQISGDGETNWIEGIQLLSLYVILGILFFYLPEPHTFPLTNAIKSFARMRRAICLRLTQPSLKLRRGRHSQSVREQAAVNTRFAAVIDCGGL